MVTLFLRYTIDPNRLAAFQEYVAAEQQAITESGGRIVGYYAPTDFAGNTNEGYGLIDVPMAEYEAYRVRLAAHPKHVENAARLQQSGALVSIYRAFIEEVPARQEGGRATQRRSVGRQQRLSDSSTRRSAVAAGRTSRR